MRVCTTFVWLVLALATGSAHAQPASKGSPRPESRHALVVGNAAYASAPLINPLNDADDMTGALRALGFTVTTLKNASLREMKTSIREFGDKLRQGGTGLFYFAGHGIQSKGRNYLIPSNAEIRGEAELEFEAVDANYVLAQMAEARNRVNIVILDACRDNPLARGWRSASQGLAPMDAPVGTFVAFATAPGTGAADGLGRNGVFTKHLLASLQSQASKVEDVFKRVAAGVAMETANRQIPWTASSLTRDFYFRGGAAGPSAADLDDMARQARTAGRHEEARRLTEASDKKLIDSHHPGFEMLVADEGFKMWLAEQPEKLRRLATSNDPTEVIVLMNFFRRDWASENEALVERRHPGWRETIKTKEFDQWFQQQDPETKKLAESGLAGDAIKLLDLFLRRER